MSERGTVREKRRRREREGEIDHIYGACTHRRVHIRVQVYNIEGKKQERDYILSGAERLPPGYENLIPVIFPLICLARDMELNFAHQCINKRAASQSCERISSETAR